MKNNPLIGRIEERKTLEKALQSPKAEMVSIIGRRRIGKTFLVKSVYGGRIDFEITGIQQATRKEQLRNFMLQISKYSKGSFPISEPKDWLEAFYLLSKFLETKRKEEKMAVFLDELPWLATHRSGFLKGLSYFWNSWAVDQNIVVVICGSAASWMIKKVVHHKGGLHNRITKRISLKPFNLIETEHFFKEKKFNFDRYQILQLYMALGGVPHYLDEVEADKSAAQNINQICFSENGLLQDEFSKLYASLFENSETHVKVVRALAKKRKGMTRSDIVLNSRLPEGGGASKILEELLHSGFISVYYPFRKKKKDRLYRLTDEYSLFYLQFIEKNRNEGSAVWKELSQTQAYKSWAGYAFENICLKHIPQIKKALGIAGVYSTSSTFIKKGNQYEKGIQIDLLIERNDHVINICEIKFYNAALTIDKSTAMELRNKMAIFKETTHTRKQIFLTMITTFGIKQNMHSLGLVDVALTMDDLY
ncbi:MAG TPA: ATP-binding protein [Bacteroidetes bacterium]|nr:ATP-binding protein [Bacteroidota bacterium]